jgi:hypothetical protein
MTFIGTDIARRRLWRPAYEVFTNWLFGLTIAGMTLYMIVITWGLMKATYLELLRGVTN